MGNRALFISRYFINVPLSIGALPSRFFSHIRSHQKNEAGRDVATFDLTLLDERGRVLGEIEGFSMRLVRDPRDGLGIVRCGCFGFGRVDRASENRLSRGIAPALGAQAFTRILLSDGPSGIFVLPDGPGTMAPATGMASGRR